MKHRHLKWLTVALAVVLLCGFAAGFAVLASASGAGAAGTAGDPIVLLPADGTPSEEPAEGESNPFAIKTTHGVTYWNFGAGSAVRSVTYKVDAPVAGEYCLAINYNSKNSRKLAVTVNGGEAQIVSVVQNSTEWGDNADATKVSWGYVTTNVVLNKGENTLVIARIESAFAPMFADLKLWTVEKNIAGTEASALICKAEDAVAGAACYSRGTNPDGVFYNNPSNNLSGDVATYYFDAPAAGDYYVGILYNAPYDNRYLNVSVNSAAAISVNFKKNSSNWGDAAGSRYTYYILKCSFNAGQNSVNFSLDGTNKGVLFSDVTAWPASEWMTFADNPVVPSTTIFAESPSGFDGKAIDVGNNASDIVWNVDVPTGGTYRLTVAYSTSRTLIPEFSASVGGKTVMNDGTVLSTLSYGGSWDFLVSEEFELSAGEEVPVTVSLSGGSYIGGVRLERVGEDEYISRSEVEVSVTYDPLGVNIVYSVDILWDEDLTFDYKAGASGAWNPADHTFAQSSQGEWTDAQTSATVKNHSNAPLAVSVAVENFRTDATVALDKTSFTLATAEGTEVANAPSDTVTATVSGTPTGAIEKVATVTFSFSAGN